MSQPDEQSKAGLVRVMVVDDQYLIREGIVSLLSVQSSVEVVGTAANGQQAVEAAQSLRPDVVLMDVQMPIMDGVEATALLHRHVPTARVLMLTTFDDEEYIVDALSAGAVGYLLKDIPAHDLAQAIISAHKGVYQLDATVAAKVVAALNAARNSAKGVTAIATTKIADLTNREIEVLHLIAKGVSNREIAQHLMISEGTVKNHVSNILSRLGLHDRTQAALFGRQHGLG